MYSFLLLALPLLVAAESGYRPALEIRQSTVQEVCGSGGVDCGDGWCCFAGNTCASATGGFGEKQCLTSIGDTTLTIVAFPYRSEAAQSLSYPTEAASSLGAVLSSATRVASLSSDLAAFSSDLASLTSGFASLSRTLSQFPTITGPMSGGDATTQPRAGGGDADAAAGLRAPGLAVFAGTAAVWVIAGLAGGAWVLAH
ncbi:hypothetical protein W97_06837 [Coniosporium apollinis CBS 100218]|uniref:Extracellular membrane protein CFEM domain-containing protein n=1 Tax=Coniosporium apollinis (strain CBS 100218) TaxID=1168221 RepID=R7Z0Y7_CONA1|nr:uncharacterized protein W97_06837 [Coniosporium apollinis CBS 100218]EON67694.1 hypothetical protein W97_06837 [Coniosporium apollinis CBS 100218]